MCKIALTSLVFYAKLSMRGVNSFHLSCSAASLRGLNGRDRPISWRDWRRKPALCGFWGDSIRFARECEIRITGFRASFLPDVPAGCARRMCPPDVPAGCARRMCPPDMPAGCARRMCPPDVPAGQCPPDVPAGCARRITIRRPAAGGRRPAPGPRGL